MNQWKPNKHRWYSMALVVLLGVAFLVASTGTAYARYRTEYKKQITFDVREKELISLGTVKTQTQEDGTTREVFTPTKSLTWETTGDYSQMTFVVANGISETEYSRRDQKINIRILGSLGLWTGTEVVNLYLHIPSEEAEGGVEKLQAKVTKIGDGTVLSYAHGPGWIYSFQNSDTEELSWTLPGGKFSYITLTVSKDASTAQAAATLQPQVIAEVISN